MKQNELNLNLSIDDINKVMTALGTMPYIQVYQIINKIQNQVGDQIKVQQSLIQDTIPENGKD